jgi:site-specific recombinase XerD
MVSMFLVLNKKSPYYQLVFFRNGRRTSVSTGTANKKSAEKFLTNFNPEELGERNPKMVSLTLSKFAIEYKTYVSKVHSARYLEKSVTPSFNRLRKYLPDEHLKRITTKDVDQFIASVQLKSKYAASLYYRTLKAAFNKAVVWNYLDENPFNKIKSPKVANSFPVYITEAELILILNKTTDKLLMDIITTAFFTGMRLGELINMKWDWIDFKEELITVKNTNEFRTKSKRERIIPIHYKVKTFLLKYSLNVKKDKESLIFYRVEGIKLNAGYISKQFKKLVREAKLNDRIHFHSLRHSFASALIKHGVSLYIVKELLGHSSITTTQKYSHLNNGSLSQAINLLKS